MMLKALVKKCQNTAVGGSAPALAAIGAPVGVRKSSFNTRFVYNSKVKPALVEANLAKKLTKNNSPSQSGTRSDPNLQSGNQTSVNIDVSETDFVTK